MSAQATVQITKKVAIGTAGRCAVPFLASEATMLPQYARPISTVSTDPQRNHHSARDIRLGRTLPLVAGSSSFMNGNVDEIEEIQQAEPGHAADKMQPTKQHQKVSVEVGGEVDVGQGQGSCSEGLVCKSGSDDCRWLAREMKPGSTFWAGSV
jgi:hypothetical protein